MSVYSAKTNLSSILKVYSSTEREKNKNAVINKVRFEMPKQKGILEVVSAVDERNNFQPLNEFIDFLRETELSDEDFVRIYTEARTIVHKLSPKFTNLVEALLSLPWAKRSREAVHVYTEFSIDLMVAHTKYIHFGVPRFIALWIPGDTDALLWSNGTPNDTLQNELQAIHKLLDRILSVIPMSFDVVLEAVETKFPYYKKSPHVVAGYLHNLLWLLEYKPIFMDFVIQLILQKLIILDVNAPRSEIEETEESDVEDDEMEEEENIFEMDDINKNSPTNDLQSMKHPIAQTLDICMEKTYAFLDTKNPNVLNLTEEEQKLKFAEAMKFFKILLSAYDNVILPSHNTHHIQFLLFYFCSFKHTFAIAFLDSLWSKLQNPNVSAIIRQTAVGYIASFLARAKYLPISILKDHLKNLCDWAHQYIERSDQYRANGSLKANLVFFSVCQAIFYVIAFRSRDLTVDKKSLLFLQSRQLSALVTCNFNPLRVCLPAVATAFAGVTRAYQLAYCHTILERNARRKLATVYTNDTATPEETLDIFFPFDPYLLKISNARILPHYLQYQASDAEELSSSPYHHQHYNHHQQHNQQEQQHHIHMNATMNTLNRNCFSPLRRKRGDSEMDDHDVDDFIIADKRQRIVDLARSQERETQFTYGLSPGFHM